MDGKEKSISSIVRHFDIIPAVIARHRAVKGAFSCHKRVAKGANKRGANLKIIGLRLTNSYV